MARIASKVLWWSAVPDATHYSVRLIPSTEDGVDPFDYAVEPQLTVPQPMPPSPEIEADLANIALEEGTYDIYVTARDPAGNESDPLAFADSVLDFVPPAAPAQGGFR